MNNFRSLIEPFRISDKLTLVLKQRVRLMSRSWEERRKEEHVKEEKQEEQEDKGKMAKQRRKTEANSGVARTATSNSFMVRYKKVPQKISLKNRKEQKKKV